MTQQEKDRLHLKKQNRRLLGQLLGIILPPAVTIIIALILFLFAGIKASLVPSASRDETSTLSEVMRDALPTATEWPSTLHLTPIPVMLSKSV